MLSSLSYSLTPLAQVLPLGFLNCTGELALEMDKLSTDFNKLAGKAIHSVGRRSCRGRKKTEEKALVFIVV